MFDMDDTLINFSGSPDECWRNACVACSSQSGEINIDDLLQTIREFADWYWSDPDRHRVGRMQLEKTRCMFVTKALKKLGWITKRSAMRSAAHTLKNDKK